MAHIYVSTDSIEAEVIIEDVDIDQETRHRYNELTIPDSDGLAKKIGFNPMSSIQLNQSTSNSELDDITRRLLGEGLFIAVESNGKIETKKPSDIFYRTKLVQIALGALNQIQKYSFRAGNLFLYSNNPNRIREFFH